MSDVNLTAPMSISPSPAPQPQPADCPSPSPSPSPPAPAPAPASEPTPPFRLLDLPVEIVLLVIDHLDERCYSASFPCGPGRDLLRLSETSRFFLSACRPRIWSAISYAPVRPKELVSSEFRQSRGLSALNQIVGRCQVQEAEGVLFPPLPIVRLSVQGSDNDPNWMLVRALQAHQTQTEDAALTELVSMLGKSIGLEVVQLTYSCLAVLTKVVCYWRAGQSKVLQVLFVAYQSFTETTGPAFLRAVVEGSPALSAIRFNSVDGYLGKINLDDFNPNFDNLRTIQIMHGHKMLVSTEPPLCPLTVTGSTASDATRPTRHRHRHRSPHPPSLSPPQVNLTRLAPNLESLLLWPASRRLGDLGDHIASKLGQLRNLSLDAVHEPAAFSLFANAIDARFAAHQHIPLEELFLEGPQVPAERDALIAALRHTAVKRLALYHLRKVTPALVESIVAACPQ